MTMTVKISKSICTKISILPTSSHLRIPCPEINSLLHTLTSWPKSAMGCGEGCAQPRQCKILIMLSNQPAHAYGTLGSVPLTTRCTGFLSKTCLPRLPKC